MPLWLPRYCSAKKKLGELAIRGEGAHASCGGLSDIKLGCVIEFMKGGQEKWLLFRITGAEIRSPLMLATRGNILEQAN